MEEFEECNLPHILNGLATLKMQSSYITFAKMTNTLLNEESIYVDKKLSMKKGLKLQ